MSDITPGQIRAGVLENYVVHEYVGGGWWHIDERPNSGGGLYAPMGRRVARRSSQIRKDKIIGRVKRAGSGEVYPDA